MFDENAGSGRRGAVPSSAAASGAAAGAVRGEIAELLRSLPSEPPGPALASGLASLSGQLERLAAADLVEFTVACERVAAWAQGLGVLATAALAAHSDLTTAEAATGGSAAEHWSGQALAAAELSAALPMARTTAEARVQDALHLTGRLPGTVQALVAGRIDLPRARAISQEAHRPGADLAATELAAIEAAVLPVAPGRTVGQVRNDVRRAMHVADPDAARRRRERAHEERCVSVTPRADGLAELFALLPLPSAAILDAALSRAADAAHEARRAGEAGSEAVGDTHQQRRADALAALGQVLATGGPLPFVAPIVAPIPDRGPGADPGSAGQAPRDGADGDGEAGAGGGVAPREPAVLGWWLAPHLPRTRRRPVCLAVTVPLSTLLGADGDGARLDGYGYIDADLARELARDAADADPDTRMPTRAGPPEDPSPDVAEDRGGYRGGVRVRARMPGTFQVLVRQHLSDALPPGAPAGASACHPVGPARRYRPLQDVLDAVRARDDVCRYPSCRRPAEQCDVDHVVPYSRGGATCACNLTPLCRSHHRLKTTGGWSTRLAAAAELVTTSGMDGPRSVTVPAGTLIWTSRTGRVTVDDGQA